MNDNDDLIYRPPVYEPPKPPSRITVASKWLLDWTLTLTVGIWPLWVLLAFGGVVLLWAEAIATRENAQKAAWMAECVKDRKHYECVAMWRAGEQHDQVVPVFIPISTGR